VLIEAQLAALEKAKAEKVAQGEFGNMKGVGRIYRQTSIDTYAKVSFAKLYDRRPPITAANLLARVARIQASCGVRVAWAAEFLIKCELGHTLPN
jgi:hypothetical protein